MAYPPAKRFPQYRAQAGNGGSVRDRFGATLARTVHGRLRSSASAGEKVVGGQHEAVQPAGRAVCHANNGSGDSMLGKEMYPRPPIWPARKRSRCRMAKSTIRSHTEFG